MLLDLSPIKQLDTVLDFILNQPTKYVKDVEVAIHYKLSMNEIDEILNRLVQDGYIKYSARSDNNLIATIDGRIFKSNGGYEQKHKDLSIHHRNERIRTLILTYGTGLAGAYGLFEVVKWLFHHEHWHSPF